jgi:hypothetical protein
MRTCSSWMARSAATTWRVSRHRAPTEQRLALTGSVVPPTHAPTTRRVPQDSREVVGSSPDCRSRPGVLPSNHVVRHEPRLFFDC